MKRSHVLVLATMLGVAGVFGESATASSAKRGASPRRVNTHLTLPRPAAGGGGGTSSGRIDTAAPSPNAAARIRSLGLDDEGGPESDDDGGLPGGKVAHGSITSSPPARNAAARIRFLGADD